MSEREQVMRLGRRGVLLGAAASGAGLLGGCVTAAPARPAFRTVLPPARLDARADRISRITVCVRPFRAAGPRLDAETVGDKLVVHNYGHGGSGWSLSWGSAEIVVRRALAGGARDIAVIGCGALGLTAALTAQRAGAQVTIYAKERMPDVRSARATGTWSPDSRVALAPSVAAGFPELWEQMTRTSFRAYHGYLGMPGDPVEFSDRYNLFDGPPTPRHEGPVGNGLVFAHYADRVRDLTPRPQTLGRSEHPFNAPYVQKTSSLTFNIAPFGRLLMSEFLQAGGRIETLELHTPADLAPLRQKVVINCTGYGARALWKDESLTPVRGQIAWLIPQPELDYGIYYRGASMLARSDGIVIQYGGQDEAYGYGDDNEAPDRREAEETLAKIAAAFAPGA